MIIKRYFWRELLFTFAAVMLVLVLVFAGQSFVRLMAAAVAGDLPGDIVLKLMLLKIVSALGQMIPFAWFIGVLLAFGRLYKDNEMTILSACGVSFGQTLRYILVPTLLCAAMVTAASFHFRPWAEERAHVLREEAGSRSEIAGISPGGFNEIKGKDRMFYVESISDDRSSMSNVFIQGDTKDRLDLFTAPSSRQYTDAQTGERYMVLENGYRYEKDLATSQYRLYEYGEASMRLEQPEISAKERKRRSYGTRQLWESHDIENRAEFQWRLAMPISALVLTVLAVLLSHTTPREGRYAKLFIAILVYVIYTNLMGVGKIWFTTGALPSALGMWWVHLLWIVAIVVIYGRQYGWTRHRVGVGG